MPCHFILIDWLIDDTLLALHKMPFLSFKTQLKCCLLCKTFLNLPSRQSWSFCLQSFYILYLSHHIIMSQLSYDITIVWLFFLINYELLEGTDFHIHFYNSNSWHTVGTKMMFCEWVTQTHIPSNLDHWNSILTHFPTFSVSCLGCILYPVHRLIF